MTREEQIRHEAGNLADFAIAHGAPWKEYHKGFIEGAKWADDHPVQPFLPSNLNEAAEEYKQDEIDTSVDYRDVTGEPLCFMEALKDAFKAGAEWMSGQGVTKEAVIEMGTNKIIITVTQPILDVLGLHSDDKIVVQLRKKQ